MKSNRLLKSLLVLSLMGNAGWLYVMLDDGTSVTYAREGERQARKSRKLLADLVEPHLHQLTEEQLLQTAGELPGEPVPSERDRETRFFGDVGFRLVDGRVEGIVFLDDDLDTLAGQ